MSALDFRALLRAEREKRRGGSTGVQSLSEVQPSLGAQSTKEDLPSTSVEVCPAQLSRLTRLADASGVATSLPAYPAGLRYYPGFLSEAQSEALLAHVVSDSAGWHTLKHAQRRVKMVDVGKVAPGYISTLFDALESTFPPDHPPNHVLINEYGALNGIMAHTDGPNYYPLTVTVSLGSAAIVTFDERLSSHEIGMQKAQHIIDVLLEPGSALAFSDTYYSDMVHSIAEGRASATTGERTPNASQDARFKRDTACRSRSATS